MEADHVFWAKRYKHARMLCRLTRYQCQSVRDLAELDYMMYLTHVFSFMIERKKCCDECTYYDKNPNQGGQNGQSQK